MYVPCHFDIDFEILAQKGDYAPLMPLMSESFACAGKPGKPISQGMSCEADYHLAHVPNLQDRTMM